MSIKVTLPSLCIVPFLLIACALTPPTFDDELRMSQGEGSNYALLYQERVLPPFPHSPSANEVRERALLTNGDLESAYFDWVGALQKVRVDAAYPPTNTMLEYRYALKSNGMSGADRSRFDLEIDPMKNLTLPFQISTAGEIAFHEANATKYRFIAKKLALEREILSSWAEYTGLLKKRSLYDEQGALLALYHSSLFSSSLSSLPIRSENPTTTEDTTTESIESRLRIAELRNTAEKLTAKIEETKATLLALLHLPDHTPLIPPQEIEEVVSPPVAIEEVEALLDRAPLIIATEEESLSAEQAITFAQQEWLPQINPLLMFTGTIERAAGFATVLPTATVKIRAEIAQAIALHKSALARLRQQRSTFKGQVHALITLLRDNERELTWYDETILPLAQLLKDSYAIRYRAGTSSLLDFISASIARLSLQEQYIDLHIAREKMRLSLDEMLGRLHHAESKTTPTAPGDPHE